jgi:hypothetical protein
MIRLVWLFLFISVYWWGSSGSVPVSQALNSNSTPKNHVVSVILLTFIFFLFIVGLYRLTPLKQTLEKVDSTILKLCSGVIALFVAYCSYRYNFILGILFSLATIFYIFYLTYFQYYLSGISQRVSSSLGLLSETSVFIFLVFAILIAFSFTYIYLAFSLTLVFLMRLLKNNKYNPLAQYWANSEYNAKIREYHRPKEFPLIFHVANIIAFTLVLSLFFLIGTKLWYIQATFESTSFFQTLGYLMFALITLNVSYNLYITWFSNFASRQVASETGSLLLKAGISMTSLEAFFEEVGIMEPTPLTKIPRKTMGMQVFETTSQKQYQSALNANLPFSDRDTFFEEVGIYGPTGVKYPITDHRVLVEKKLLLSKKVVNSVQPQESLGEQTNFQLLTTYQAFDPVSARILAEKKKLLLKKQQQKRKWKFYFQKKSLLHTLQER